MVAFLSWEPLALVRFWYRPDFVSLQKLLCTTIFIYFLEQLCLKQQGRCGHFSTAKNNRKRIENDGYFLDFLEPLNPKKTKSGCGNVCSSLVESSSVSIYSNDVLCNRIIKNQVQAIYLNSSLNKQFHPFRLRLSCLPRRTSTRLAGKTQTVHQYAKPA